MKVKMKQRIKYFSFMIQGFWKHGKMYIIVSFFIAVFANVVSALTSTCMNRDIINSVLIDKDIIHTLIIVIVYQVTFLAVSIIDTFVNMCFLNKHFVRISSQLNKEVFEKALKIKYYVYDDPVFYDKYSWAIKEYVNISDSSVELLKKIIVSLFSIGTLFTVFSVINVSWFIVAVTSIYIVVMIPLDQKLSLLNVEKKEEMHIHNRKLDYIQRIFYLKEYAQILKITLMPIYLLRWYKNVVGDKLDSQRKYNFQISIVSILQISSQYLLTLGIMCFYIFQIYSGVINIGDFVALVSAASLLRKTMYELVKHRKSFYELSWNAQKVFQFFNSIPEDENSGTEVSSDKPWAISFEHVSFFYPHTKAGISDININIQPGQKIAIVGYNGAGKTTLVKLLLKLYDPSEGRIIVNGIPIQDYNINAYRLSIGVALQETSVFSFSIRENLSRYEELNDCQINGILEQLSLNKIADQSNRDYSRPFLRDFDKEGIELSGGERQKIAIGSLMSKKFPLLILDEPTSALDPIAEYELNKLIINKSCESTTIIISHRLSSIKEVDQIVVMNEGKIVEIGTHKELYERKSLYYEMYRKQLSMYNQESE